MAAGTAAGKVYAQRERKKAVERPPFSCSVADESGRWGSGPLRRSLVFERPTIGPGLFKSAVRSRFQCAGLAQR